jgi:cobalt-zinc-cadmium efflux system outer membrane protein
VAGQVPNPTLSVSQTGAAPRGHLIVEQPLSWMLSRAPARGAAQSAIVRSSMDSTLQLARLGGEVSRAFYALLGREARYQLMVDQQGVADSAAEIARRRYQAGDVALFELEQVQLEAQVQRQLLSAEVDEVAVSRVQLGAAIGWPQGPAPRVVGDLAEGLTESGAAADSSELPLIAAARADSEMAALSLHVVERERIPFPVLQVGTEWDDPADPGRRFGVIGVSIPVPIWNWGGSQVAQARARADSAAAGVLEVQLDTRQALDAARIRLAGLATRARFARDSMVPAATRLRSRALAAYRAGETDVIPVLLAIRREREIQLAVIDALVAFQAAVASVNELLGRTP